MSDIIIFGMGCFVSLVVASAVGLLFWGAANEPRGTLLPSSKPERPEREVRFVRSEGEPSASRLESQNPA